MTPNLFIHTHRWHDQPLSSQDIKRSGLHLHLTALEKDTDVEPYLGACAARLRASLSAGHHEHQFKHQSQVKHQSKNQVARCGIHLGLVLIYVKKQLLVYVFDSTNEAKSVVKNPQSLFFRDIAFRDIAFQDNEDSCFRQQVRQLGQLLPRIHILSHKTYWSDALNKSTQSTKSTDSAKLKESTEPTKAQLDSSRPRDVLEVVLSATNWVDNVWLDGPTQVTAKTYHAQNSTLLSSKPLATLPMGCSARLKVSLQKDIFSHSPHKHTAQLNPREQQARSIQCALQSALKRNLNNSSNPPTHAIALSLSPEQRDLRVALTLQLIRPFLNLDHPVAIIGCGPKHAQPPPWRRLAQNLGYTWSDRPHAGQQSLRLTQSVPIMEILAIIAIIELSTGVFEHACEDAIQDIADYLQTVCPAIPLSIVRDIDMTI